MKSPSPWKITVIKYKVGDKVKIIADSNSHGFLIGEIVTIEKVDNRFYEVANYYIPETDVELHESAPDYRALYEQEKELREAAEDFIEKSPCDPDIYPEQIDAWNHYQQLKQQYNGKETKSNTTNNA